jgi:hypothetical protein
MDLKCATQWGAAEPLLEHWEKERKLLRSMGYGASSRKTIETAVAAPTSMA